MDEEMRAGNKLLRRHNHLITAFRRAAHNQGWDLNVVKAPDNSNFPFILMCIPTADAGLSMAGEKELLFLFAAHDTFIQSNVIADVCRHLRNYQDEVSSIYILFDEKARSNVESVMRVSGLTSHTTVLYFRRIEGEALFDWSPGRKVLVHNAQLMSESASMPLLNDQI